MNKKLYINILLFIATSISAIQAQTKDITIQESDAIKELLKVRIETIKLDKGFRIQVYNGSVDEANKIIKDIKSSSDFSPEISFETPNYKVRLGKFRTRLEAEKALVDVKKNYPSAFVVFQ